MKSLQQNSTLVKPPTQEWERVNKKNPCPVCGHPDWCLISQSGCFAICPRVQSDHQCGDAGWLHRVNGDPSQVRTPPVKVDQYPSQPASSLDIVYRYLLDELSLNREHEKGLLDRGIDRADIALDGYKSLPREGRPALAQKLRTFVSTGELPPLAGIPGFYLAGYSDKAEFPNLAGASGLLIPVKDADGLIVGLQIRADGESRSRYQWLSSNGKRFGSSPGAPVHVARGANPDKSVVWVTEGQIKANIIARRTGLTCLAVAGVSNYRTVPVIAKKLGAEKVYLAYDMDKVENANVRHYLKALAIACHKEGLKVYEVSWPAEYKGLDDLLASKGILCTTVAELSILLAELYKILTLTRLRSPKKRRESSNTQLFSRHSAFKHGETWVAFAELLRDQGHYYPFDCLEYGIKNYCSHEGEGFGHTVLEPAFCGDWHNCPPCDYRRANDQAEFALNRFQAIADAVKGTCVIRAVFTLPDTLWPKMSWEKMGEFNRLITETLREYYGGTVAGPVADQYWHTKNPVPKIGWYYPHAHTAWANVVRRDAVFDMVRTRGKRGRFKKGKGKHKAQLVSANFVRVEPLVNEYRLKVIWAGKLAKKFSLGYRETEYKNGKIKPQLNIDGKWVTINLRLLGFTPVNSNRHLHQQGKRKGKPSRLTNLQYLRGRLRYDFRGPVADIAEYGDTANLEKFNPEQREIIAQLLGWEGDNARPKNFKSVRWLGWLSDSYAIQHLKALGAIAETKKQYRKRLRDELGCPVVCPVHGCPCDRAKNEFGAYLRGSRYDLMPGDVLLSPGYRTDGRFWVLDIETWVRWQMPREHTRI